MSSTIAFWQEERVSCFMSCSFRVLLAILNISHGKNRKDGMRMDIVKIGRFLKGCRKEKGITQEQAAEIFGVSGRTVSRWETGTNMPDLSTLIQIAEYYDVEIKEILNGEREIEKMDQEWKETLQKVADYSELEKEKAQKAGSTAFMIMFGICTAAIIIQMVLTASLGEVAGETAAVGIGGIAYIFLMVKNGVWESGVCGKSTWMRDGIISVLCAGIFAFIYAVCILKAGAGKKQAVEVAVLFFAGIGAVGFGVLRALAYISKRKKKN